MSKQLLFIPGPVTVTEPVLAAMGKPMIDHRGPEFKALQESISAQAQAGVRNDAATCVLLGSSGTGGLEAAMSNMFGPGDKVLCCPIGVFGERFAEIARTWGVDVEVLPTDMGPRRRSGRAQSASRRGYEPRDQRRRCSRTTRRRPACKTIMGPLADAIRAHGALRARRFGQRSWPRANSRWMRGASTSSSPHRKKRSACRPVMAMVAVSPRAWAKIETRRTAPRYYFDLRKAREFAAIGQTPATPPVSLCYAMDVALDRYNDEGPANVWARHERYTRGIIAAAEALGLELFAQPGVRSVTVTAIKVPAGVDGDAIRKTMRVERGFVLGGGQGKLGRQDHPHRNDGRHLADRRARHARRARNGVARCGSQHSRSARGVQAALRVFLEAAPARSGITPWHDANVRVVRAPGGRAARSVSQR